MYRAHNPRWSFAPHSGDGAARYGGRFNPVGVPTLYTSRRMETAWLEAQQGFPFKAQPLTICAYEVDCTDIADLSEENGRREFGVVMADLTCAWEDLADRRIEPPQLASCHTADGKRIGRHRRAEFRAWCRAGRSQRRILALVGRRPA